jgi:prephenate dehydrogenase
MTTLADMSVCLVGLGQIGGSLAKAFRRSGVGREVVGVDLDHDTRQKALELGVVDRAFEDPQDAVRGRDLVILAVPVRDIMKMIRPLSSFMDEGSILMDVGSTKRGVLAEMAAAESRVNCLGGHPMCGTEAAGFPASDERLMKGAPFVLIPSPSCNPESVEIVSGIVKKIGAKVFFLSAERHDRIVAAISHLPYVLAAALMGLCDTLDADAEVALQLAAGGFMGSTRLAESEPLMAADFCRTNLDNLESAMKTLVEKAEEILELSREPESSALLELLSAVRSRRERLREVPQSGLRVRGD